MQAQKLFAGSEAQNKIIIINYMQAQKLFAGSEAQN